MGKRANQQKNAPKTKNVVNFFLYLDLTNSWDGYDNRHLPDNLLISAADSLSLANCMVPYHLILCLAIDEKINFFSIS